MWPCFQGAKVLSFFKVGKDLKTAVGPGGGRSAEYKNKGIMAYFHRISFWTRRRTIVFKHWQQIGHYFPTPLLHAKYACLGFLCLREILQKDSCANTILETLKVSKLFR